MAQDELRIRMARRIRNQIWKNLDCETAAQMWSIDEKTRERESHATVPF